MGEKLILCLSSTMLEQDALPIPMLEQGEPMGLIFLFFSDHQGQSNYCAYGIKVTIK